MAKDGDLSNETVIESIARLEEAIQEAAAKRVPFEHPTAQAWLKDWVHGVYEGDTTAPRLPYCGISASQAGVALLEQFNDQVQQVIPQYPEEYQRNSVAPTMVLARVLVAWQETFKPDPQDWLNLRTNMGLYQRQHEAQWREQFDDERPSLLSWLYAIPKVALGYEITEEQAKVMQRSVRSSDSVASRFWTEVVTEWKGHVPALDASIGEQLAVVRQAIATTHLHHTYGDALPLALDPTVTDPLTLPVPVRDYQKGWDVAIRKMGLEYSQEAAKAEFPSGIPDTVDAITSSLSVRWSHGAGTALKTQALRKKLKCSPGLRGGRRSFIGIPPFKTWVFIHPLKRTADKPIRVKQRYGGCRRPTAPRSSRLKRGLPKPN